MTTIQAIIYSIMRGFTQFLPVSWDAHKLLLPYINHWPDTAGPLDAAMAMGVLLALLVYFRHDWASQISCFLQVIIFRKKPMTLDERMPFFLFIATLPVLVAGGYLKENVIHLEWTPLMIVALLAAFGVLMSFSDSFSRRTKGMSDWNWFDAGVVGLFQLATVFVGFGSLTASFVAGMLKNYNREAAAKFAFFTLAPILTLEVIQEFHKVDFHAAQPMPDMSWMTFYVALVVSLLTGLLAIGGFMKHVQRNTVFQYAVYRWLVTGGILALYFYRSRYA
jgi:undecaprenyl-diphosphatase